MSAPEFALLFICAVATLVSVRVLWRIDDKLQLLVDYFINSDESDHEETP